jgi:hypothetical protein
MDEEGGADELSRPVIESSGKQQNKRKPDGDSGFWRAGREERAR